MAGLEPLGEGCAATLWRTSIITALEQRLLHTGPAPAGHRSDEKGGGAAIETPDVMQSNGVVYVIDSVLMPK